MKRKLILAMLAMVPHFCPCETEAEDKEFKHSLGYIKILSSKPKPTNQASYITPYMQMDSVKAHPFGVMI